MLINEVQYKVGLTKKSIRYYESEGLLTPKRNSNNDYRDYDENDLKDLRLIKFLRELNVPINSIKKLKKKEISLSDCMEEQLNKMEQAEEDYKRIKNMCLEIKEDNLDFDTINITKYSKEMNVLNKRGITLKDEKKCDNKKILGACLSSLIFGIFLILFMLLFIIIKFNESDFPLIMFIILEGMFAMPLIGIIVNLIKRIKEIKGGEENEASKY